MLETFRLDYSSPDSLVGELWGSVFRAPAKSVL